jgi:hypothetical protein
MDNEPPRKYHRENDEFKSYIKGFEKFKDTRNDGLKFSVEIDRLRLGFVVKRDKLPEILKVEHKDSQIEESLTSYFIDPYSRFHSRRELYGGALDIMDLFGEAYQYSAMIGDVYFYINWEQVDISGTQYTLPASFDYIDPSTIKAKRDANGKVMYYVQSYSFYQRAKQKHFKQTPLKKIKIDHNDILHLTYPFQEKPAVQRSMHLLKQLSRFNKYMIDHTDSTMHEKPRSFAAELVRNKGFEIERRKRDLIKNRVQLNFHQITVTDGLKITNYYDMYIVARFKSESYKIKKFYVDEFNKQVLKRVRVKNGMRAAPKLVLLNQQTSGNIWDKFIQWAAGKITDQECIDYLSNIE